MATSNPDNKWLNLPFLRNINVIQIIRLYPIYVAPFLSFKLKTFFYSFLKYICDEFCFCFILLLLLVLELLISKHELSNMPGLLIEIWTNSLTRPSLNDARTLGIKDLIGIPQHKGHSFYITTFQKLRFVPNRLRRS
jgi:hypothetical protein